MDIFPFAALRPAAGLAGEIASLPYDVMDTAEARRMAEGNPLSFLHVVRSEIDLPDGTDPADPAVYAAAKTNLGALVAAGRLVREAAPSLYVYRQTRGGRPQTAVVACCAAADYENGTILRHEKTRKDKEDDRTAHILATRAHTGQVFLCYRDRPEIDALVAAETAAEPLLEFVADDGVSHAVWRAQAPAALAAAFRAVPRVYIADGHHRAAASARAAAELRSEGGETQRFMACLFPASQLTLLPYHRSVRDLNGLTQEGFLRAALERGFSAAAVPAPEPLPDHSCAVRLPGGWFRLSWSLPDALAADPVARLDVARLQEDLLAPVLGIGDPRTDPRIYFTGGVRGTGELERDVASGKAAAAFAMKPTAVADMMAVADAGALMPPKSTWFEPKLRSGLLVHGF
ncbi:MAG: DUF1015 domain-containing protein [Kiritimatiellae bacterium]|nr:DUF1015 domain-containing protein [Kiritimatiellia bacterium]